MTAVALNPKKLKSYVGASRARSSRASQHHPKLNQLVNQFRSFCNQTREMMGHLGENGPTGW